MTIRWFISPAVVGIATDGKSSRHSPAMMDRYPCEQWSGAISKDKTCFILRWLASEDFNVFPLDGVELTTPEQWAELYMKNPELRNHWKDQPICMVI